MLSAVRTAHAFGAGCLLTVRQDAHARANASSTRSLAVSWSPTDYDSPQALIGGAAIELREVQLLCSHTH